MTSQEFVKQKYPRAWVQNIQKENPFDKKGIWICWESAELNKKRLSTGKTASNAWVNAKKNIKEYENGEI